MKSYSEIEKLLKSLKVSKQKINELLELLSIDGSYSVINQIKNSVKNIPIPHLQILNPFQILRQN